MYCYANIYFIIDTNQNIFIRSLHLRNIHFQTVFYPNWAFTKMTNGFIIFTQLHYKDLLHSSNDLLKIQHPSENIME